MNRRLYRCRHEPRPRRRRLGRRRVLRPRPDPRPGALVPVDLLRWHGPARCTSAWRSSSRSSRWRPTAAPSSTDGATSGEGTVHRRRGPPPRDPRRRPAGRRSSGLVLILFGGLALDRHAACPAGPTPAAISCPAFVIGIGVAPRRQRHPTRADGARDRRGSPGHGAAADPGRAGVGPDPRRGDIRPAGDRASRVGDDATGGLFAFARRAEPDPGVPALADPSGHLVRERRRSRSGSFVGVFAFGDRRRARVGRASTLLSPASAWSCSRVAIEGVAARRPDRALAGRSSASRRARRPSYRPLAAAASLGDPAGRVRRREPLARRPLRRRSTCRWRSSSSSSSAPSGSLALCAADDADLVRRATGATLPRVLGPLPATTPLVVPSADASLGLALLPVAASLSQLVIALHRGVVAGPALHLREPRAAAPGRDAHARAARRSSTSRRASCTGSSATSTTAPSSGSSC